MRAVLPGKPQAKLQAICTTQWEGNRLVVYISGNALVILGKAHELLQTIYHDTAKNVDAVAIDEATGRIATSSGTTVFIHRPYRNSEEVLKWSFQRSFEIHEGDSTSVTLSWGSSEELLVGSTYLRLFQTAEVEAIIWKRKLSSAVAVAAFSYDAAFIASIARYDRLVKIWRRLSFGSDDVRFDSTYLSHPSTVTGLHWHRPNPHDNSNDTVLYTICADGKIRVWAATEPHAQQVLQLWAQIDLQEAIQPRQMGLTAQSHKRYIFLIDSRDFVSAVKKAVQDTAGDHFALEHLVEIAKRSPDVCVVMDNDGNMSAWGLENVGKKARTTTQVFNVAHLENFNIFSSKLTIDDQDFAQFLSFCNEKPGHAFTLLVHRLDHSIAWLEGRVDQIFEPSRIGRRLHLSALWTGHDGPIKKIVRNVSGRAFISRTNDNEGLIWMQQRAEDGMTVARRSSLSSNKHIHRTCLLDEGEFVVNLHHQSISLWDTHRLNAEQVASCGYQLDGKALCLLLLPEPRPKEGLHYLATISSNMAGIVWKIRLPQLSGDSSRPCIVQFCTFQIGAQDDLAFVLPVDPAGSTTVVSGFLDTFAKDIAISYTHSGVLRAWTARVDPKKTAVEWLNTATVVTNVHNPSLASGSSGRKIAVVDDARNGLTIWDSRGGQLEYDEHFARQDFIQDLDWSSTPDDQSVLAVGYPHKVIILSQMRYDYLNKGPAWAAIREIYIGESTNHPIGDSTWLGSGNLVIGVGNQLFVYDRTVTTSDDRITDFAFPIHKHPSMDLFKVVSLLNGPLPVFHPQFLAQCILSGKLSQVQTIIFNLDKALRFYRDDDDLDSLMGVPPTEFFTETQVSVAKKELRPAYINSEETVNEALAAALNENLVKISIPYLSSQEQIHMADMIECVATAEKHRRSMDDNAMRYLLFFRQHMLRKIQGPDKTVSITWREIAWAFHSGSQDILVDLVSRQFKGRMLWKHAKESGMFMWMTEPSALKAQFEVIARNEYTKTDEKNPIDCSLYYLALGKKNVLVGLWRMATWNREQSSTQKLLSNNFEDPRWKTAALKNAYALLGKRRFEYAAAFFLLAGKLKDAVNVCAHQLQDLQLAITVARVHEGDDSPVLRELIDDTVLPQAAFEGNRWLATWAFWMLGRRDMAVRALITPVYTTLETPGTPNQQAKSFLTSDPALVVLYKQLRDTTLQTLKGASMVTPQAEWEFVMQSARLYDRMGCDLLALDLVRNWEFLKQPKEPQKSARGASDPRMLLRRRSSLVVDDLPSPKSPNKPKSHPPKVFEEPDANSLLDSFGF